MKTRNFVTFTVVFIVLFLLLDRLVIAKTRYLQYLDLVEFGFELNKLAETMRLEGARIFIGVAPFILLGTLIFYGYVKLLRQEQALSLLRSFSIFLNFFIAVIGFNVLGGIIYYICTITPFIKVLNNFLSNLVLIRVYINFPLLENFKYENSYINFSFVNVVGLLLLKVGYFQESVEQLLDYFGP